jgi:hypothetical protein
MAKFWKREDLGAELRANRPEARPEFVRALAGEVRPARRRSVRVVLAAGLATAMLASVAAFGGGLGYAATGAVEAVKTVKRIAAPARHDEPTAAADQYGKKVTMCHKTGSKKHPFQTIVVSQSAVKAHLKHGDTLGPCKQGKTKKKPAAKKAPKKKLPPRGRK